MIFRGKVDAYTIRKAILDDNIQKTFSLVIGQCTDLLQSKLKQQAQWNTVSQNQDAITLVSLIKNNLPIRRPKVSSFSPLLLKGQPIQSTAGQYDKPRIPSTISEAGGCRHCLQWSTQTCPNL
jgi:hypothetical protein